MDNGRWATPRCPHREKEGLGRRVPPTESHLLRLARGDGAELAHLGQLGRQRRHLRRLLFLVDLVRLESVAHE